MLLGNTWNKNSVSSANDSTIRRNGETSLALLAYDRAYCSAPHRYFKVVKYYMIAFLMYWVLRMLLWQLSAIEVKKLKLVL